MQTRHRETRKKRENVLIAAVPTPDLTAYIGNRYGPGVKLYVAETRPFEHDVARGIARAREAGFEVVLCTDNMIGSLLREYEFDSVWSLYSKLESGGYEAMNGALMSAVLAREHGIPFNLFRHPEFPRAASGRFAGVPIAVEGAGYIEHRLDRVPEDLVAEAV